MSLLKFEPATRQGANLLVCLAGPTGSGKTYSGLLLASAFAAQKGGKVALVDTESGRGRFYADDFAYDYAPLYPPYTPERYVETLDDLVAGGYSAAIIDSVSHEWEGTGGVVEDADGSRAQGLLKWAKPKARHKRFVNSVLGAPIPLLILCCRTREKMVQQGKEVISIGQQVIQEKSFAFEMTLQLLLDRDGCYDPRANPPAYKVPGPLREVFSGGQITADNGLELAKWLDGGPAVAESNYGLLRAGQNKADEGMDALREWFAGLSRAEKAAIAPHKEELKMTAELAGSAFAPAQDEAPRE